MEKKYTDAIKRLREDLRSVVAELRAYPEFSKLLEILQGLNALEKLDGTEPTSLSTIFNGNGSHEAPAQKQAVKFDEFLGMKPIVAAQKYLKKCSDARPFSEIVQAVNDGSGKTLTPEEERKLRRSLIRSTLRIIKIKDRFGHLNNYPEERQKRFKKMKQQSTEPSSKDGVSGNETGDRPVERPRIRERTRPKDKERR